LLTVTTRGLFDWFSSEPGKRATVRRPQIAERPPGLGSGAILDPNLTELSAVLKAFLTVQVIDTSPHVRII
jgi:hypothetical protein